MFIMTPKASNNTKIYINIENTSKRFKKNSEKINTLLEELINNPEYNYLLGITLKKYNTSFESLTSLYFEWDTALLEIISQYKKMQLEKITKDYKELSFILPDASIEHLNNKKSKNKSKK